MQEIGFFLQTHDISYAGNDQSIKTSIAPVPSGLPSSRDLQVRKIQIMNPGTVRSHQQRQYSFRAVMEVRLYFADSELSGPKPVVTVINFSMEAISDGINTCWA